MEAYSTFAQVAGSGQCADLASVFCCGLPERAHLPSETDLADRVSLPVFRRADALSRAFSV